MGAPTLTPMKETTSWAIKKHLTFLGFYAPKRSASRVLRLQKKWDRSKTWVLNRLLEEGLERHLNPNEP